MGSDNWQNRHSGMCCGTCMWWVPKKPANGSGLGPPAVIVAGLAKTTGPLGRCRRHAPTMSGFPAVFAADWCGDHKLDENKAAPALEAT